MSQSKDDLLLEFGYVSSTKLADMLGVSVSHAQRLLASDLLDDRETVHGVHVVTHDRARAYAAGRDDRLEAERRARAIANAENKRAASHAERLGREALKLRKRADGLENKAIRLRIDAAGKIDHKAAILARLRGE